MYTLWFLPSAYRALTSLVSIVDRYRVFTAILALQQQPRPPDCLKLAGADAWRIRIGDYRVVYMIDDAARTVTVTVVANRRDVYR